MTEQDTVHRYNVDERIKELMVLALRETRGNRTHAAALLGVSLRTIRNWIKKHDLRAKYPPAHEPAQ